MHIALAILVLAWTVYAQNGGMGSVDNERLAVLYQIFPEARPNLTNKNTGIKDYEVCTTEAGKSGECVPYYLCDDNDNIITDGGGPLLLDIRMSTDKLCNDNDVMERCCTLSKVRPPDRPIKPTPTPQQEARIGCGWRNPNGADMRTTGEVHGETKFGEFPWMCAIFTISPSNDLEAEDVNLYVAGGSLIHPSVVLTVAHRVSNVTTAGELVVRTGDWDTNSYLEIYPHQDRNVQSMAVHPNYNNRNMFYDIAILFLAQPMVLAPNVGLACLPPPLERARDGSRCFATGWGKDRFIKGHYQQILKKVELSVVERSKCQRQLRNTRLGSHFKLHSSFMCAGGETGVDMCTGDGGSPLSCPIENQPERFTQSGIVSWGIGCQETGVPGVYVDVSEVRNWIDGQVAGRGYDTKVYAI